MPPKMFMFFLANNFIYKHNMTNETWPPVCLYYSATLTNIMFIKVTTNDGLAPCITKDGFDGNKITLLFFKS